MMIFDPGAGEPTQWFVCFSRHAATWWLDLLPVGKFKHVRAFGLVPAINTWIFFDPALDRTAIRVARGDAASRMIGEWMIDSEVVRVQTISRETLRPRLTGWCVPQVKAVLGLSCGALRPDALLQDCLRLGGRVITADEVSANLSTAAA
jgi:hypothetical protein